MTEQALGPQLRDGRVFLGYLLGCFDLLWMEKSVSGPPTQQCDMMTMPFLLKMHLRNLFLSATGGPFASVNTF